jgi:hypothetical protein
MKRIFFRICVAAFILFALLVISFIVWRVSLAHDVNAKLQAIRAAGLPTSGAELNSYYPAVPDNENAALVITQAFALMRDLPKIELPTRTNKLTAKQRLLITACLETNHEALARAREAVLLPKSRYPVNLTPGCDALLPHIPKIRKLATLVGFETLFALESQDSRKAVDSICFQIALSHTLDAEPLLISRLCRGEIISSASKLVEYSLNQTTPDGATLLKLEKDFTLVDERGLSPSDFISDQAIFLPYFHTNWPEIIRICWSGSDSRPSLYTGIRGRFGWATGLFDQDTQYYLKAMQTAIDESKRPFPECLSLYITMHEVAIEGHRRGFILGPGILEGLRNVLPRETEAITHVRLTTTTIAVERFRLENGQLPENLNELVPQFLSAIPVDPFDGQPLRYHRLAKGYVIYSVGSDGHDDGGREKAADWKSSDKTTYDITFTVER